MCRWELLPWISHESVLLVLYCWFACDVTAAMLMVKNKSISLVWEQNSLFMYIIQEKIYCIDSQHGRLQLSHGCKPRNYTWKTWWLSVPAASEHSDNLPKTSEHCRKCPNVFQWPLNTSRAISKMTILGCCDTCTVTTLQVKIFVQLPFGDQLFGFSHQRKFLGTKLYQ